MYGSSDDYQVYLEEIDKLKKENKKLKDQISELKERICELKEVIHLTKSLMKKETHCEGSN